LNIRLRIFCILEYAEKIPFVKDAPVEQDSKTTAAAAKKK
jgi:hypothetical protein